MSAGTEGTGGAGSGLPFAEALLTRLVCPLSRGPLLWDSGAGELVSPEAGLAFPVRNGVPVLLLEEARITAQASSP